jgi:hypothetical protein
MCGWKNVRVGGGTLVTTGTTYNGSLIMSGGLYTFPICCNGTDSVNGFLRTEGTGTLQLNSGDGTYNLVVRDSAVFGGGDESGLLVNSYLRIGGNFIQRGLATSFQASPNHNTVFEGTGTQTVSFASPGAGLSGFGTLQMAHVTPTLQPAGITLLSPIYLSGFIYDTSGIVTDSIAGQGFTVTAAAGLQLIGPAFVMNKAPLVTNGTSLSVSGLTFRNMNPAATYLTMNVNVAGSNSVFGINFATPVTSGVGKYFSLNTGTVSYSLTVTSSLPAASSMTGNYVKTGSPLPTVTWNGTVLP